MSNTKWGSPVSGKYDPLDYADIYDGCEPDEDHSFHGEGDEMSGPDDINCHCRNTVLEDECARQGCGFCSENKKTKKTKE